MGDSDRIFRLDLKLSLQYAKSCNFFQESRFYYVPENINVHNENYRIPIMSQQKDVLTSLISSILIHLINWLARLDGNLMTEYCKSLK